MSLREKIQDLNEREHNEIMRAVAEERDLTPYEKASFELREMALNIRHWLQWTKESRAREGLDTEADADVQFPYHPNYRQFGVWADSLERAAKIIREMGQRN